MLLCLSLGSTRWSKSSARAPKPPCGAGGAAGRSTAPVAVKQLRARDPAEAKRVLEEVTALVALDHPHVVRVLEVLESDDGVIVVMQYAPGGSLAELLSARRASMRARPSPWPRRSRMRSRRRTDTASCTAM